MIIKMLLTLNLLFNQVQVGTFLLLSSISNWGPKHSHVCFRWIDLSSQPCSFLCQKTVMNPVNFRYSLHIHNLIHHLGNAWSNFVMIFLVLLSLHHSLCLIFMCTESTRVRLREFNNLRIWLLSLLLRIILRSYRSEIITFWSEVVFFGFNWLLLKNFFKGLLLCFWFWCLFGF